MPAIEETLKRVVSTEEVSLLRNAFLQFEENAKRLENAYAKMQDDFKKLNLELDAKNEELKRTLEETSTMRERLNCVLQSLKTGVIVADVNGMISHFNRTAEQILGIEASRACGRLYSETVPHAKEPKGLLHTLKTGEEIHNEEREFTLQNGGYIPIRYSTSLVTDNTGKTLGAVEVFHDISDIKGMEQEIQQARTLAALGEMSATVAHEIRNPLGGIGTYAALLERDLDREDPRRKLVKSILQGIASLNKIVTNLLVYTRPMQGGLQKVALNEILKEISDFALLEIQSQHRADIRLKRFFPKQTFYSRIDPEKLQQLLLNLFFNAAQAIQQGGEIRVRLRKTQRPPESFPKAGIKCWNSIAIEDTGCGISPQDLPKIFNPFYTTREDGTGLGLAIVRKIAEFHKGHIHVKSKPGKGSTFELYLPAVEA